MVQESDVQPEALGAPADGIVLLEAQVSEGKIFYRLALSSQIVWFIYFTLANPPPPHKFF